jgi:hypothetical protein
MPVNNVTVDVTGITQGGGAALWVQSSGDWWTVTIDQTERLAPARTDTLNASFQYSLTNASFTYSEQTFSSRLVTGGGNAYTASTFVTLFRDRTAYENATGNFRYTAWNTFTYTVRGTSSYKYTIWVSGQGLTTVTVFYNWSAKASTGFSYTATGTFTYKQAYLYSEPYQKEIFFTAYNATWSYTETVATTRQITVPGFSYIDVGTFSYTVVVPEQVVYDQKVSLRQSIAGNVALVTSWLVSSTQVIRALKVRLTGNQISTKAYSDPTQVAQIGEDLVYTATGAEIVPRFGITISPSSYGQGTVAANSVTIAAS